LKNKQNGSTVVLPFCLLNISLLSFYIPDKRRNHPQQRIFILMRQRFNLLKIPDNLSIVQRFTGFIGGAAEDEIINRSI